ncbi:MAG: YtxH domain-containing protein [Chloroflexi bacterium]|nr:YtxH domain-containing protein [Chloroflexota bacterium]
MPTSPAKAADDVTDNIKTIIDRLVDAKFTQDLTKRGQDVAGIIADRGSDVEKLASEAWKDTKPMRRDAAKRFSDVTDDAAKWSDHTWRKSLRPALRDLWKQRTVAIGAAGAAVPAGRELVDSAAIRLGLKQREERHWGAFFLGLLLGAAAGAIAALLTTPKRGSEMRHDLGAKADEIATKAKEAEWVPIFQRDDATNGHADNATDALGSASDNLADAASEAGSASGEAADKASADTAEAINESFDSVDRESRT